MWQYSAGREIRQAGTPTLPAEYRRARVTVSFHEMLLLRDLQPDKTPRCRAERNVIPCFEQRRRICDDRHMRRVGRPRRQIAGDRDAKLQASRRRIPVRRQREVAILVHDDPDPIARDRARIGAQREFQQRAAPIAIRIQQRIRREVRIEAAIQFPTIRDAIAIRVRVHIRRIRKRSTVAETDFEKIAVSDLIETGAKLQVDRTDWDGERLKDTRVVRLG